MMAKVEIGVGVFAFLPGAGVPIMLRKSKLGQGSWGLPGGKIDFGETLAACARRETLEEIGCPLDNIHRLSCVTEEFYNAPDGSLERQFVTFYFVGIIDRQPVNTEPSKCAEIRFIRSVDDLSALGNVFSGTQQAANEAFSLAQNRFGLI